MFHLIPKRWHRAGLQLAYRLRHRWRLLFRMPLAGVMVIGRDALGAVLLVRHSYGTDLWSLPGGGCKRSEDPSRAARREMREELGCDLAELELVETMEETISGSPHTAYIYTALICDEPKVDGRELIAARFFPLDALPEDLTKRARQRLSAYAARGGVRAVPG